MTLKGWHKPLPKEIEQAVRDHKLAARVIKDKKYGRFAVLQGTIRLSSGMWITYV